MTEHLTLTCKCGSVKERCGREWQEKGPGMGDGATFTIKLHPILYLDIQSCSLCTRTTCCPDHPLQMQHPHGWVQEIGGSWGWKGQPTNTWCSRETTYLLLWQTAWTVCVTSGCTASVQTSAIFNILSVLAHGSQVCVPQEKKVLFSLWTSVGPEHREGPKACPQRWTEVEAVRSASGCWVAEQAAWMCLWPWVSHSSAVTQCTHL